jgi:hypothetical protein
MRYLAVSNGTHYGSLVMGKPMPYGYHRLGSHLGYATKDECQEWVYDHLDAFELLEQSYDGQA